MNKKMKRLVAMLLCMAMVFAMTACGQNSNGEGTGKTKITLKIGAGHVDTATQWTYAVTSILSQRSPSVLPKRPIMRSNGSMPMAELSPSWAKSSKLSSPACWTLAWLCTFLSRRS